MMTFVFSFMVLIGIFQGYVLITKWIKDGKKSLLLDMYNDGDITDKTFTKYHKKLNI